MLVFIDIKPIKTIKDPYQNAIKSTSIIINKSMILVKTYLWIFQLHKSMLYILNKL